MKLFGSGRLRTTTQSRAANTTGGCMTPSCSIAAAVPITSGISSMFPSMKATSHLPARGLTRADGASSGAIFAPPAELPLQKGIRITKFSVLTAIGDTAKKRWNNLSAKDELPFRVAAIHRATKDTLTKPRGFRSVAFGTTSTQSIHRRKNHWDIRHRSHFLYWSAY